MSEQSTPAAKRGLLRGAGPISRYISENWEPKTESSLYYDVKSGRLRVGRNGKHITATPEAIDAQYVAFGNPTVT
jgi:hypothetical protein